MCGIHQQDSFNHLQDMLRRYDVSLLVLLEPKVRHSQLARFAYSIGFQSWLHGGTINTHIWVLWKSGLTIELLWIAEQAITIRVLVIASDALILSLVHASCLKRIRAHLWDHLDEVAARVDQNNEAWAFSGDFNKQPSTIKAGWSRCGSRGDLGLSRLCYAEWPNRCRIYWRSVYLV